MSKFTRTLLAAVFGAVAMSVTAGASAHGGDHREYRGHGWGHHKHWQHRHHHPGLIRERIIIRQPPPVYYEPRVYYDAPPYYQRHNPAIVIGVDIPPVVIPLY